MLEQQVRRMIADPRSEALVENFTGQWLNVRGMQAKEPVVNMFPDFDSTLREAFRREIELFFDSIVHEDRSVLDLLTADYTFVNERLAKHYGIPNVYGSQFRRVHARSRAGHAPRTARQGGAADGDVGGGAHLAGDPRQVVPADVPRHQPAGSAAERAGDQGTARTRRETPKSRRCGSGWSSIAGIRCARRATTSSSRWASRSRTSTRSGMWRTEENGTPIDTVRQVRGRHEGRRAGEPAGAADEVFRSVRSRIVTEKLLTYALGRGVEYQDMPLVRKIVRDAAASNYRFSSLVMSIVTSEPFQMNMKMPTEAIGYSAAAR